MRAIPAGDLTPMVAEYVRSKIPGVTFQPGMYQAMLVENDDHDFVAGVVISEFRVVDCQISCAGETPMAWRPHVCRAVFDYIFNQLGCVRCTSITTKRNKRTRDFLDALGFTLEGRLRRGYDGEKDALIYGLLASECRFLLTDSGEANGEEYATSASSAGPVRDSGGAVGAE